MQHGIGKVFSDHDFDKKNADFINEFKHNTAVFAAFKNYRQTKEMVELLHNEDGNLRSFREFKKLAASTYKINRLQTEYNTAVRAARTAANYRKYLETEHLYPNLEYIETSASHPRVSHLGYVGTILPIRHEWWDTHMPPSDWNCACSVRPTDKKATAVPDGDYVNPVFQNNPGKSAEFVKLKEHPYVKEVSKTLVDEIERFVEEDEYIELKKFKNGGRILLHRLVNTSEGDYKDKYTIARKFAKNGAIVKLTPVIHYKSPIYERVYKSLINTPYYKKCPDLMVGDLLYEYERYLPPFKARKISNMISNGSKQSPYLIINNNKGATHRYIRRNVFERLNDKTFKFDIKELWVYEKGKLNLVYKKQ